MISFMTKRYIRKRVAELMISSDYLEILKEIEKRKFLNGIQVRFSWLYNNKKFLCANAFYGKYILLNPEWATMLILYNDTKIKNAFNITIGHELTHREKELRGIRFCKDKRKFVRWVNEVHADFGGAQKMADSSREKLLASIKYKSDLHTNSTDNEAHPSWKRRKCYVENYDFEPQLVRKIASDIGYNNQVFIEEVCNFYPNIKLQ